MSHDVIETADADPIPPRVTDPPAEIWLVYGDIECDCTHWECCRDGEVAWCEDSQYGSDQRYVHESELHRVEEERDALQVDAERYRWLRAQNWSTGALAVVASPKAAIKLGYDCPFLERLDVAIDAARTGTAVISPTAAVVDKG